MILYGHTVITQNVDLLCDLLTALQTGFDFIYLSNPLAVDALADVVGKFGIFDVFGIRINRINGRIAFFVGTVLLKGLVTTGHFLRVFGYRLFQVTTGGRYRTDECDGARLTVIQLHIAGTTIEVGYDG